MIFEEEDKLVYENKMEHLEIIAWGNNSLRVRSTKFPELSNNNQALTEKLSKSKNVNVEITSDIGSITNGKIKAQIDHRGKIIFLNQKGDILLEEYQRSRNTKMTTSVNQDKTHRFNSALKIKPRVFSGIAGGDFKLTVRFEANHNEKIFGMGQYQQDFLNLKGSEIELAQRNSQASVPFMISSLGYGLLWNNPAIGNVIFGKNITTWVAEATKELDYWITADDSPKKIERN